jgi:hypothetical protein
MLVCFVTSRIKGVLPDQGGIYTFKYDTSGYVLGSERLRSEGLNHSSKVASGHHQAWNSRTATLEAQPRQPA